MKRIVCLLLAIWMGILSVSAAVPPAAEAAPAVAAQGVAVYNPQTGEMIYEKNVDGSVSAAFTVKVMTVYLAMQSLSLDDTATVAEGFREGVIAHSGLDFAVNEQVSVRDLCYAVLVKNANEACNILATATGRTIEEFIGAMNDAAAALGMTATHFADTHGESAESYTTPRDAVKLLTVFAQNADLMQMANTTFYRMPATAVSEERLMYSANLFINPSSQYYYAKAQGIKIHYDSQRGYSQGTYCEFNGMQVICAVFNGSTDAKAYYSQVQSLLEWVRAQYKRITVLSSGMACGSTKVILCRNTDTVMLVSGEPFSYIVPTDYDEDLIALAVDAPEQVEAPVNEGDALGTATITYDGTVIGTVSILAGQTAQRDAGMTIRYRLGQFFSHPIVIAVLIIAAISAVLYMGYFFRYSKKRKTKGKKK